MPVSRATIPKPARPDFTYPDCDEKPIAENTLQFQWIVTFKEGMERVFRHDPNVFVTGDLLWYPVEGKPKTCTAPDTLVVFGRPKGYRGSYIQFREDGVAPQVVMEVLSPTNLPKHLRAKFRFYQKYGVEEYYVYDPENIKLTGYQRQDGKLKSIRQMNGWVSPRRGVRFDLSGAELKLFGPDGERFLTYQEIADERDQLAGERDRLAGERDAERRRAERLAALLRSMGVEPPA